MRRNAKTWSRPRILVEVVRSTVNEVTAVHPGPSRVHLGPGTSGRRGSMPLSGPLAGCWQRGTRRGANAGTNLSGTAVARRKHTIPDYSAPEPWTYCRYRSGKLSVAHRSQPAFAQHGRGSAAAPGSVGGLPEDSEWYTANQLLLRSWMSMRLTNTKVYKRL